MINNLKNNKLVTFCRIECLSFTMQSTKHLETENPVFAKSQEIVTLNYSLFYIDYLL